MSSKNISTALSFLPDVKSAEKQLHEHEVETTTSSVMYYCYGVGKSKSKVRGTPQMNSGYEMLSGGMQGCGCVVMGRPRWEGGMQKLSTV